MRSAPLALRLFHEAERLAEAFTDKGRAA